MAQSSLSAPNTLAGVAVYVRRRRLRRQLEPYLYLVPAALVVGAVVVYPLIYTLGLSLFDVNLLQPARARFVGLGNYVELIANPTFWHSLGVTAAYTFATVAVSLLLGLGTALLLNREYRFRSFARAAIILPWATPWLVTCLIWYVLFNPQFGLINAGLRAVGLIQSGTPFLYQSSTALLAVVVVTAWRLFPMATLLLLAGLQGIPREQYEAASVDGAGAFRQFRHITLPNLATVGVVVAVLLTIWSFKLFTVVYVLTAGGPGNATQTLAIYSYEEGFKYYNLGTGSTIAMLMVAVSAILVAAYFSLLRRNEA
ncbi:MAG: sugar ABC transporter permease [Chloroflexi bacterium]|nr:sugar ABC transporter permease [Chloroflexota bacterium]